MKYQKGNADIESIGVIIMLIVVFSVPSYYFGKSIQRTENTFNCKEFGKIELSNSTGNNYWVECKYPTEVKK